MNIKKLNILIIPFAVVAMFLLPQGRAEMWEMTEEDMDRESVKTYLRVEATTEKETEAEIETDELLEDTEEDRFDQYLREKSLPEIDERLDKRPRVYIKEELVNENSIWSGRELTSGGRGHEYVTREQSAVPRFGGSP
jgi:hypothetical protein